MARPPLPEPLPAAELSAALGVECPPELMIRALTHRSYAYEHGGLPTNERLEFLGDAVLGLVITEALYRQHPDLAEGQLAKLRASIVNMRALAGVARQVGDETSGGLGAYVYLGRGEQSTGGSDKPSILADTLEAVIGATFEYGGIGPAAALVLRLFEPLLAGAGEPHNGLDSEDLPAGEFGRPGLRAAGVHGAGVRPRPREAFRRRRVGQRAKARRGRRQQQEGSRAAGRRQGAGGTGGRGPGAIALRGARGAQ